MVQTRNQIVKAPLRHRFHAICPYFAMFPEGFVAKWVECLTKSGDIVLDPFCGRGNAPFQSILLGRRAIGNDINPVAYCVSKAKTNAPPAARLYDRILELRANYRSTAWEKSRRQLPEFFHHAYQPSTLRQILYLRSNLRWNASNTDCMLSALVLGMLHGESARSSSYLSNQMPRTISTKPAYSLRYWKKHNLVAPKSCAWNLLQKAISFRYKSKVPAEKGIIYHGDMRQLPYKLEAVAGKIKCVITSPPYLGVTRFEEDQWLRLWFLGGPPKPTYGLVSTDDRHERPMAYWQLISDTWRVLSHLCAPRSNIVIRIGGKGMKRRSLLDGLCETSKNSMRPVKLITSCVSKIKRRQTRSFRPGSVGCSMEVDCHFLMK